jgi:hypothetical protein
MTMTDGAHADVDVDAAYRGWGFDQLSDAELLDEVASAVRRPRERPADSFVLHAPLELTARAALLPFVRRDRRDAARVRIFSIASAFEDFGPPAPPSVVATFDRVEEAAAALDRAIDDSDLGAVDAVATWLGRHATPMAMRSLLADTIVPRLSAAAHGSIFLYLLPRVAPRGELTGELLRPLGRELARYPDWRLRWQEEPRTARPPATGGDLFRALQSTPQLGSPGSDFIFPVMSNVETTGVAAEVLSSSTYGVGIGPGAQAILRAAAWSMLLEPERHRPYGWTHCLTLPQAVLGIADSCTDPHAALAVAATYVVGFRAAMASEPLEPHLRERDPGIDIATALTRAPHLAAASVWYAEPDAHAEIIAELATRAATHSDAHFAKYTQACFDAAAWDRSEARLYLAAAAALAGYWATR